LNILKGTPNAQITKTAEMLKAIVEEARPNLLKELLNVDHATLGTSKQRLAMAQKIMNNVPQEDSALVADIIPPGTGKEMAVKVLEASASEEASGENNANTCGFDPNIDISKKCKWSLMRRFIKKLNSTEIKNLFDELGQRARKAILLDMFDLADPNDLEACAEMIVVEPSIKAFVKGLSDEACDFFPQHTAQRLGEDKAVAVVAPQLAKSLGTPSFGITRQYKLSSPVYQMSSFCPRGPKNSPFSPWISCLPSYPIGLSPRCRRYRIALRMDGTKTASTRSLWAFPEDILRLLDTVERGQRTP